MYINLVYILNYPKHKNHFIILKVVPYGSAIEPLPWNRGSAMLGGSY